MATNGPEPTTSIARVRRPLLLAAALAVLAGCGSPPPPPQILRIWPLPPAPPRIYLRQVISSSEDFKRKPSFAEFLGLLAGRSRQRLQQPVGIAADANDLLYVADQGLQGVHVIDLRKGKFSFIDRVRKGQFLVSPVGVAVCGDLLAISDSKLNKVFLLNAKGKLVQTIDKPGGFGRPTGMAADPVRRELYVADTVAGEVCVFDWSGALLRRFGSPGAGPAQFNGPTHLFVTAEGQVFVSDSLNCRVQIFDRDGKFISGFGRVGDATGHMATPKGVAVDADGHIYLADSTLGTLQVFDRQGDFLLSFAERGSGVGAVDMPAGLAIRGKMLYVCDFYAARVEVFEYMGKDDEPKTQPDR
ncbi:MAG: hypothetical protein PHU85_15405 [Phycisphaerae bacterium]|nr:hypothetical protein [Phycisphaerae bacterium]